MEEGSVKHIYFVAETKGGGDSLMFIKENHLRGIEEAKILCAEQHFKAISSDVVKYDAVRNYEDLLKIVHS